MAKIPIDLIGGISIVTYEVRSILEANDGDRIDEELIDYIITAIQEELEEKWPKLMKRPAKSQRYMDY